MAKKESKAGASIARNDVESSVKDTPTFTESLVKLAQSKGYDVELEDVQGLMEKYWDRTFLEMKLASKDENDKERMALLQAFADAQQAYREVVDLDTEMWMDSILTLAKRAYRKEPRTFKQFMEGPAKNVASTAATSYVKILSGFLADAENTSMQLRRVLGKGRVAKKVRKAIRDSVTSILSEAYDSISEL